MALYKKALLAVLLALCVAESMQSPRGSRSRDGDRLPRFKPLLDFACKVDNITTGETISERACRNSELCTLGPMSVANSDGELVAASFCAGVATSLGNYKGVLSQACSLATATEVLSERACPENVTCSVGPLGVTIDGSDASAFFCDIDFESRADSSRSGDDDSDESDDSDGDSRRGGGRRGGNQGRGQRRGPPEGLGQPEDRTGRRGDGSRRRGGRGGRG